MGALFYYSLKALGVGLFFALLAVAGVFVMTLVRERGQLPAARLAALKKYGGLLVATLIALVATTTFGGAFVNVPAGHRGVIFSTTSGVSDRILPEGIHAIAPVIESYQIMDVRKQKSDFEGQAATKDQQSVHTKVTVWFMPDASAVQKIYQRVGMEYAEKLIPNQVSEVMKAEISKYNALGLLSNRELVASEIRDNLKRKLAADSIIIDQVAIGNFEFSPEFNKAIEEKQMAEQGALKKTYELQAALKEAEIARTRAQGEAQAEIAKAQGQAQAARIVSAAISANPNYMALKQMENRLDVAKALAGSENVVYLPSNTIFSMPAPQPGGK